MRSSLLTKAVDKAAGLLSSRGTRRSFLAATAVVGSAVVVSPKKYLLEPTAAYAALCGPASTAASGYTAFCCTIYRGENKCPPGTFVGGWWRADGSSYCCTGSGQPGARYYIDCQAECRSCNDGCDPFCSQSCWNCQPYAASGSCDARRVCWNVFRYGQCNTQLKCGGPVACRVVTCVPPYQLFGSCGSTTLYDNNTANHTAPCLTGACA
jgi:hypothetical protein